jgi:hypothetical protein
VDSSISLVVASTLTGTSGLSTNKSELGKNALLRMTDGVGADQADERFDDSRTLAASASEDLDLSGVLTNALNEVIVFVKVKAIIVIAAAGNTNNVVIGGAASNTFVGPFGAATHTIEIGPGDFFAISRRGLAGLGVTAGSADKLKIANGGGTTSVDYDIIIFGTTA